MFGRGWVAAQATIVARSPSKGLLGAKVRGQAGQEIRYDFVVDVEPPEGSPTFRSEFEGPWDQNTVGGFKAPDVGTVVRVQFNPKTGEVKFDPADRTVFRDARALRKAEADYLGDVRDAPAGRPGASDAVQALSQLGRSGPPTDDQMRFADDTFQTALASAQAAVEEYGNAKRAGDTANLGHLKYAAEAGNTEVQSLNAEFQRLARLRPDWKRS